MVFHALNRGVGRMEIFRTERDYEAFEETIEETLRLYPMRILAYCLMPTHWHFVLWPAGDGDLSAFLQRLTNTHTQRWQRAKNKVGHGHLYQSRFKSFPVETDDHFYTVVRYVERNALRANLAAPAEAWRWGSLWRRVHSVRTPLLTEWPLAEPQNWTQIVNQPQTEAEVIAIRRCILRSCPYGNDEWVQHTASSLGLESTLRPRGRPKATQEPRQR
jgi:putative transposase